MLFYPKMSNEHISCHFCENDALGSIVVENPDISQVWLCQTCLDIVKLVDKENKLQCNELMDALLEAIMSILAWTETYEQDNTPPDLEAMKKTRHRLFRIYYKYREKK